MLGRLLLIAGLVLVPSAAFAWGPLTHVYLGSEIFYLSSLLPAAVYKLISKYRQDYLYGNLTADIILAKKYLSTEKNPHNWDVALGLLESSDTEAERAFSLGYMSHLAADTVAHGRFTAGRRPLHHTLLELRADGRIDRSYWFQAVAIDRKVQVRNDAFLEKSLERVIFSFKTNKRIFKGAVALSWLNNGALYDFMDRNPLGFRKNGELKALQEESLDRIVDVLKNGASSEVLKKDPIGSIRVPKVLKAFLG